MCDCLVALGPATAGGATLFAKNSDRPPAEVQVLEWFPPRREPVTQATHLVIDGHRCANRTTIPGFDAQPRHPRQPVDRLVDPRLAATDRVLAAGPLTCDAVTAHLRSHAGGDGGCSVCMHAAGVQVTAASMVAELPVDGPSRVWTVQGSPCERGYERSW